MFRHICITFREMVKTQKSYRSKLRQQVAENYPQKFKGNVDDPDFANLPAPVKLCLKAVESIKDFRVSIIVPIKIIHK
jgi:hypothetical protein